MTITTRVPGAVSHREITVDEPRGFRPLLLDVHVPQDAAAPVPCVVWVHGGGWELGDRRDTPDHWPDGWLFTELVRAGLAVAAVDYRLSGEAHWPAQIDDVRAGVTYLRQHADTLGLDVGRFGVSGESAGGHLAAMAALTGDGPDVFRAAAVLYGVTDLAALVELRGETRARRLGAPEAKLVGALPEDDPAAYRAASPLDHATPSCPPMLLISGDRDQIVPLDQSVRLHDALLAAGAPDVVLEVVPGADHCFWDVDPVPPLRVVVDFLTTRLST